VKRASLSKGALAALLAAGAWLAPGCLNPRPEELPSEQDIPSFSGGVDLNNPSDPTSSNDPDDAPAQPPSPGAAEAPSGSDNGDAADAGAPDAAPGEPEPRTDAASQPETGEPPE